MTHGYRIRILKTAGVCCWHSVISGGRKLDRRAVEWKRLLTIYQVREHWYIWNEPHVWYRDSQMQTWKNNWPQSQFQKFKPIRTWVLTFQAQLWQPFRAQAYDGGQSCFGRASIVLNYKASKNCWTEDLDDCVESYRVCLRRPRRELRGPHDAQADFVNSESRVRSGILLRVEKRLSKCLPPWFLQKWHYEALLNPSIPWERYLGIVWQGHKMLCLAWFCQYIGFA